MPELEHFYNEGTGWICRDCERNMTVISYPSRLSRAFCEGEAESKAPVLANQALAKWVDASRSALICPRCGITENTEAPA